jgi:hypothetical protein
LLGVAALLAVLINGFGAATLTEPWNPYLPLLWWVVVLLAVWSVVCGDIAMLPVAVAAASFCGQTHVPYLVLSVGLGVLAAAAIVVQYRKADKPARAHITRWVGASAALGFVLWLPPIIDQVRHSPGNLAILFNYFTNSPSNAEPAAGLSDAATVVLRHLDVFHLSADQLAHPGLLVANDAARHASGLRGALLLVAWAVAALVAWRVRSHHRGLVRLHLVTATALGLSFIATSRIYGEVWYYLVLSMWAITGMMVVASIWTAVVVVKPRVHDPSRLARIGLALLVAITVVFSVRSAVDATVAEHSDATVVRELHAVVPGTVTALDHDQRYLLGTDDAAFILSPLYGMLNELDRRGFDVGVTRSLGPIATTHRVTSEDDADARIQIATGKWIDAWRQIPDAREVASYDPRSPEQKARFDQLHAEVTDLLTAQGHADIVPLVDDNLFAASITPGVGRDIRSRLEEMLSLGVPIAVFIAPTQAHITP